MENLTINQLETYLIDCVGHSQEELNELKQYNYKEELINYVEAQPEGVEACIKYSN